MGLQQQLIYILLLFGGKQICSNGQFKIQSNFYNALIHANNALMPPNRHALIHPNVNEPENLQVEFSFCLFNKNIFLKKIYTILETYLSKTKYQK